MGLNVELRGWAVSILKCNELKKVPAEVERLGHEQIGRASPVERLARPGIELPGDSVEFVLREGGLIGALREVLPKQAIGVLVDAVLPRTVGISEIDAYLGPFRQAFVLSHFPAWIVSNGKAPLRVDAVKHGTNRLLKYPMLERNAPLWRFDFFEFHFTS